MRSCAMEGTPAQEPPVQGRRPLDSAKSRPAVRARSHRDPGLWPGSAGLLRAWARQIRIAGVARRPVTLVTGAGGEMGQALIHRLAEAGSATDILTLDVKPLDPEVAQRCAASVTGDIRDHHLLERLRSEFEIHAIFHLAAILSTRAEFVPEAAHEINVEGTLGVLRLAAEEARWHGRRVKFLFPSSIAVYGLPDLDTKRNAGRVVQEPWIQPITMYGC